MHEKLGAYSGGIRAATSQFSGAGEGGPNQLAFEAAVTNDGGQKSEISSELVVIRHETGELGPFVSSAERWPFFSTELKKGNRAY